MKFKQGQSATELRPFSVEDPTGTSPRAPRGGTKARTRTTARAPTPARAPSPPRTVAPRHQRGANTQAASNAQLPAAPEKKTSLITVLIILGVIAVGAQTAGLVLWRGYNQSQLKENGQLAHGRILSVSQTSVTINDARVYEVEVELRLPNHLPFKATVEQSFSPLELSRLNPESWVEVRYNPESTAEFVITRLAIAAPAQEPVTLPPATVVQHNQPPEPAPQAIPVEPTNGAAATKASDTERLSCAQARACCRIVSPENAGCDSYMNPHIPDESCRLALSAYVKAATSLGKSCQGF